MSYQLQIQRSAIQEMHEAFVWYELRQSGLGYEFAEEIEACLEKLTANPQHYTQLYPPYRRILVKRFPYAVFYEIEGDTVFVVHVRYQGKKPLT
jgi:plasmid stabilization system protein ParE